MDARERLPNTKMSTNLPADLIERILPCGTAKDPSPSAVIERAIALMFMERSDEALGNTLRKAQDSEESHAR